MSDLVEWLTKILDEDERVAQAAFSNQADPENGWGDEGYAVSPNVGVIHEDVQRTHVVRWHPGAVLADIAAKRAIIARHAAVRLSGDTRCAVCIKPEWPCATLHDMATAYADRPGYDEGWRP